MTLTALDLLGMAVCSAAGMIPEKSGWSLMRLPTTTSSNFQAELIINIKTYRYKNLRGLEIRGWKIQLI